MWPKERLQLRAGSAFLGLALVGPAMAWIPDFEQERGAGAHGHVPHSVAIEHEQLHKELARVIESGGRTATEARNVEKMLRPHFVKEEQFALPPLAVLPDLASGKVPPNATEIIKMSDSLQSAMPTMLTEHEAIGKALERLRAAGQEEHKPEAAKFAEHLKAHAKQEEEILYPAAILAGRYLKLRSR